MAKKKKKICLCPLTYRLEKGAYDQEIGDFTHCIEEQCAWFNQGENCCSIKLIGDSMAGISRVTK